MKHIKRFNIALSLAVICWSIYIDVTTYNVWFPANKNIVLYCIDGIVFNWMKIITPLAINVLINLCEKLAYEGRTNRCR